MSTWTLMSSGPRYACNIVILGYCLFTHFVDCLFRRIFWCWCWCWFWCLGWTYINVFMMWLFWLGGCGWFCDFFLFLVLFDRHFLFLLSSTTLRYLIYDFNFGLNSENMSYLSNLSSFVDFLVLADIMIMSSHNRGLASEVVLFSREPTLCSIYSSEKSLK